MPTDPLATLRDIHTAPTPPWWPPAPGWWLAAVLLGALLIGLLVWALRALRRRRLRLAPWRSARQELNTLYASYRDNQDPAQLLRGVSALLRRAALVRSPREQVAAVHGHAWLDYLDRSGDTREFTTGSGRVLADGPYRVAGSESDAGDEPDYDALHELVRLWLVRGERRPA